MSHRITSQTVGEPMTLLRLNLREWKALETVAARTTDAHILRRAQAFVA